VIAQGGKNRIPDTETRRRGDAGMRRRGEGPVRGAAIDVHRELGLGRLESTSSYKRLLIHPSQGPAKTKVCRRRSGFPA
jgi:hypothetical protein